jgi:Protein of Unknown function (DUF2784)
MYPLLADIVLVVHLAFVILVVGGLVAIVVGNLRGWPWVNSLSFRALHATAIGIVVLQAWLGQDCPLTVLESWLRRQAGSAAYDSGFIQHWVQQVLFYQAPTWIFTVAYSLFGAIVAATWWYFPPRRRKRESDVR